MSYSNASPVAVLITAALWCTSATALASQNAEDIAGRRSTDAVPGMTAAGINVIHAGLDGLHAYRATLDRNSPHANVWGHYLGNSSRINTSSGAAFRLEQSGVEIGADTRTAFNKGDLITGAVMSYSGNDMKHAWGGKSTLDSYGLGLYATWFDNRGFYIDYVLKGNRLNNKLNATMTNGGSVRGDWHQYALSNALETGYQFTPHERIRVEPFARLTSIYGNNADIRLNNGMKAKTGSVRSIAAEAGSKAGTQFSLGSAEVKPYFRAGLVQEMAKSNEVKINNRNSFDNNVNGTSGKYGAGTTVNFAPNTTFYSEVNYRQGSHIESPLQGVAGIRIGF